MKKYFAKSIWLSNSFILFQKDYEILPKNETRSNFKFLETWLFKKKINYGRQNQIHIIVI